MGRIWKIFSAVLILLVLALLPITETGALDTAVTTFPVPALAQGTFNGNPVVTGPDGNLWFTAGGNLDSMTTSGNIVAQYPVHPSNGGSSLISGPNNSLWFIAGNTAIGSMTTSGVVAQYPVPAGTSLSGDNIVAGPDGNIWFEDGNNSHVGKMTPSGTITEYPLPAGGANPGPMVAGPDGNIWFFDFGSNSLAKMTTSGTITEYLVPAGFSPYLLASGSDGNIWFTDNSTIGSITPSGSLNAQYPLTGSAGNAAEFVASPDGNLLITGYGPNVDQIASITTSGVITTYQQPGGFQVRSLGAGPDGNLWYADSSGFLGRIGSNQSSTPPSITSTNSTSSGMRVPIVFQVTTTGTPKPTLSESGALPSGLAFQDNGDGTASFTGIAAAGTNGNYPIIITTTNSSGTTRQNFTLTITTATSVPGAITTNTGSTSVSSSYGTAITPVTITATGFPAPHLTNQSPMPSGLNFHDNGDGTATISGTPGGSAIGSYSIDIIATNSLGTYTQTFTFIVNKKPVFNSIANNSLKASVGTAYSLTTTAVGYSAPAITESGTLPSGLNFMDNGNGTATISGTPAAGSGGSYTVTQTATNSSGSTTKTFTITVSQAPAITSANSLTVAFGVAMTPFTVTTTGYPASHLSASAMPSGVTFHDNGDGTATIAGTPSGSSRGTHTITITATNSKGTATQSFTLTIQ